MSPLRALGSAVLALSLLTLAHPPAQADPPTYLTLTAVGADVPTRVPVTPDDEFPAGVTVRVSAPTTVTDATFTTSVDGVGVDPASGPVGTVTDGHPASFGLALTGVTPGLHALTVTVSGADVATSSVTFPFLWVPGNQAVTAHDSLAGHVYETTTYPLGGFCEDCSVKETSVTWFVDGSHVFIGNPRQGRPSCPGPHCSPYAYDATTGLVQIGSNVLGRFDRDHAVLVSEAYEDPEQGYGDTRDVQRVVPFVPGHTSGSWAEHGDTITPYDVQLRLARNGTYHLRDRLASHAAWRGITGRYRIGADRALHLLTQHRTTKHHRRWPHTLTLLALSSTWGYRDRAAGVWLAITHGGDDPSYDQDEAGGYELPASTR